MGVDSACGFSDRAGMKAGFDWPRSSRGSSAPNGLAPVVKSRICEGFLLVVSLAVLVGCGDGGPQKSGDSGLDDGAAFDTSPGIDAGSAKDVPDSRAGLDVAPFETAPLDSRQDRPADVALDALGERSDRDVVDAAMDSDASGVDAGPGPALDGSTDSRRLDGMSVDGMIDATTEQDAASDTVVPTVVDGGVFSFSAGTVSFVVNASEGARVVTYALGGTNAVTTSASHPSNYGSTFWPSPQSDWNWPPPVEIDPGPYGGSFSDGALTLTSATTASLGLAVRKQFSMDPVTGDVLVRYSMLNKGSSARAAAPWEITRVVPSGIVFFPMGTGSPRKGSQDLLDLTVTEGIAWFAYDASAIERDQKVFVDGAEGWIAHVDGGVLLIKSFSDIAVTEAAPGEAEIEIFANAAHSYVEVENQGAYKAIAAGAASTWPVRWFLRKVPAGIPVTVGSSTLVDYVRKVIAAAF